MTVTCIIESCRNDLYTIEFLGPNNEVLSNASSNKATLTVTYVRKLEVNNTGNFRCLVRLQSEPQVMASAIFTFEGTYNI